MDRSASTPKEFTGIKKSHICGAITQLKSGEVFIMPNEHSTRFCLVDEGYHLPPKLTLRIAAKAAGRRLAASEFNGGKMTNDFLRDQGFKVEHCSCRNRLGPPPRVVRLVLNGPNKLTWSNARKRLLRFFASEWPYSEPSLFAITPGGFINVKTPLFDTLSAGWNTPQESWSTVVRLANEIIDRILDADTLRDASKVCRYLTLGIDVEGSRGLDGNHAELVATIDTGRLGQRHFTGKSYPTVNQERNLIRCTDLQSHNFLAGDTRVLILGCHDLNVFSARAIAKITNDERRQVRDDYETSAVGFNPDLIIHHPHTTDSPRIWTLGWSGVAKFLLKGRIWCSSICYYNDGDARRATIHEVLAGTKSSSDFLIRDIVI